MKNKEMYSNILEIFKVLESDQIVNIYYGYSGRSMCGESCTGLVTLDDISVRDIMIKLCQAITLSFQDEYDEAVYCMELILNSRQDNLGMNTIIYWPELDFEEID